MNTNIKTASPAILGYVAAMALACVLVASNAHAGGQGRSETVSFADLDLSTSAGVEALYGRIHAAARHVCTEPSEQLRDYMACVSKAEGEAVGKVNRPLLTAFYQKKTGKNPEPLTANR
jgi:UrcA family protein